MAAVLKTVPRTVSRRPCACDLPGISSLAVIAVLRTARLRNHRIAHRIVHRAAPVLRGVSRAVRHGCRHDAPR